MAANERQIYFTNNEEEIRAYEMREMALMDERARIRFATDEGHREGLAEGRKEGLTKGRREGKEKERIEIARKALAEGAALEFIQKITDLDAETIKDLNKQELDK